MTLDSSSKGLIMPYKGIWPSIDKTVYCAPNATIIGDVTIGAYSSIWFHTVIRGDVFPIRIGEKTNIQDLCVGHVTSGNWALTLEDEITVGHRAVLHGCHIKSRCLIGMGAVIMDGVVIGEESIVGAGALVTEGTIIPPRTLVLGAPAKVKRELGKDQIQLLSISAEHYADLAQDYIQKCI